MPFTAQQLRNPPMTRMERLKPVAAMMLGSLALSACAPTVRLTAWKINQATELKTCQEPRLPPSPNTTATVGEMDLSTKIYSLRQASALHDCATKNAANTSLIEKHNSVVDDLKKPWWKFW